MMATKWDAEINQPNNTILPPSLMFEDRNLYPREEEEESFAVLDSLDTKGVCVTDKRDDACVHSANVTELKKGEEKQIERESEFHCREREMDIVKEEKKLLRISQTFRSESENKSPNVDLKMISNLLSTFDTTKMTFLSWRKSLEYLRSTYNLDEGMTKIVLYSKVKGKTLEWLHSKPEAIKMGIDELLDDMQQIFKCRPSKVVLRKNFEDRKWARGEMFMQYFHDKMILGNYAEIGEKELMDYMIEGIPHSQLRDLAIMQSFRHPTDLLRSFERISPKHESSDDE